MDSPTKVEEGSASEPSSSGREATKRKALGRGLAALFPQVNNESGRAEVTPVVVDNILLKKAAVIPQAGGGAANFRYLGIERLKPNKKQPRKEFAPTALAELSQSIKAKGILQPIVVRKEAHTDLYEIVAGERRWRAAMQAGLTEVPVFIKDLADIEALQIALIENLQRQDLDPLEEAEAYYRLISEYKMTHEQLALAVGKSRAAISNSLRLLKLPSNLLGMLADGRLTAGHARALMMLTDTAEEMQKLADAIVERKLSVREAENQAKQIQRAQQVLPVLGSPGFNTPSLNELIHKLQTSLGLRVSLRCENNGKGSLSILFNSLDELDVVLDKLLVN